MYICDSFFPGVHQPCKKSSKNSRRFNRLASWYVALLVLGLSSRASAALLAYEGFNYTPGDSLTNASAQTNGGSFGWGGRWAGAPIPIATNAAGSLTYVDTLGNMLVTNGGSVVIGAPNGTTANSQPSRSFNFGTLSGNVYSGLTGPRTNWMSYIMQWVGPVTAGSTTNQYVRKGDLVFRAGINTNAGSGGTALYSVGSPNAGNRIGTPYDTWATWTGNDQSAGTLNTGLTASSNALNALTFVLVRIDLDGGTGNDTVYTWFNWTNLTAEPPISTASLTNNSANQDGLNNLRLDANGGNPAGTNTVLAFDEFRFGETFADVTPYSSGLVPPPTITIQPADTAVTYTYPASFSVAAMGAEPIYYQWYFNTNTLLTDQTNATLTIASVQTNDAGGYHCVVANAGGSVTSLVATLTVLPAIAPSITTQPQPWTNAIGFAATFTVVASGSAPLRYQWYFNGTTPLSGRTNATLSFIIASTNDAGAYHVVVTNLFGSATSDVANLTVGPPGAAQLPAFPGADGAAKLASGGRGGTVYHVTKLNSALDDPHRLDEGTLFYGLSSSVPSPKTIVFDVAGVFHLGIMDTTNWTSGGNAWDSQSRQGTGAKNITIAGETAPGPVIIMGGTLKFSGSNMVVRNITVAGGYGMKAFWEPDDASPPAPGKLPTSFTMDCIEVDAQKIMLDHITGIYGTDESISCNELARDFTCQYCLSALSQNYQDHGFGHLLQPDTDYKLSYIHNLDAHIRGRLPRVGSEVGTGALNDFRDNVTYNWGGGAGYSGASQYSKNNFINNFYLSGHGGDSGTNQTDDGGTGIFSGSSGYTFVYRSGNLKDTDHDGDPNDTSSADNDYTSIVAQPSAYDIGIGVTLSAKDSFTNVLRYVGSRWWARDDSTPGNTNAADTLNRRLVNDVFAGTGRIQAWADDPYNISGTYVANPANEGAEWRALWALRATNGVAPFTRPANWDTDGDGMPDWWEIKHGLNPNPGGANNNADFDNDYYTDLEEYLNEIAAWPAPGPIVFTGDNNHRYALIFNWRVYGVQVNITNLGNVTTFSYWQPSRYDTAVISNTTVIVDAVGQHAGTLRLTNNATLDITNGWFEANTLAIGSGCTLAVEPAGTLRLTGSGTITLATGGAFTNAGTLDIMTWTGTLPAGFVNTGTVLDRSLIEVDSVEVSGSDLQVKIQGYRGHNYQLQYRDDLSGGSWQNAGTFVGGSDALLTLTHTGGATGQQRFYRVAVD
jgi:hypothetical protein